eukprot:3733774-Pleurochrysis_carterae.AAC.1
MSGGVQAVDTDLCVRKSCEAARGKAEEHDPFRAMGSGAEEWRKSGRDWNWACRTAVQDGCSSDQWCWRNGAGACEGARSGGHRGVSSAGDVAHGREGLHQRSTRRFTASMLPTAVATHAPTETLRQEAERARRPICSESARRCVRMRACAHGRCSAFA